jgi:hypothetical protein
MIFHSNIQDPVKTAGQNKIKLDIKAPLPWVRGSFSLIGQVKIFHSIYCLCLVCQVGGYKS